MLPLDFIENLHEQMTPEEVQEEIDKFICNN